MKHFKTLIRTLSLAAAVLFLFASVSYATPADLPEIPQPDQEKLLEFWQQEAYDGMTNGEAVYVYQFPEGATALVHPTYSGTYYTDLISFTFPNGQPGFGFSFMYDIWYSMVIDDEAVDGILEVTPDLYGPLDLASTSLTFLNSPDAGQTHIDSVIIDNCGMLTSAKFSGQESCTLFSALNCPALEEVELLNGAFRKISVGCEAYEAPVCASAFGTGSVGMAFNANSGITLAAYPAGELFTGWFENGTLISSDTECTVDAGGDYYAVFSGDADGNCSVDVSDAVLALRIAMGLVDNAGTAADVNGNGTVEIADAVMILRFAMGVI